MQTMPSPPRYHRANTKTNKFHELKKYNWLVQTTSDAVDFAISGGCPHRNLYAESAKWKPMKSRFYCI